jgi:hypothetical protein
MAEAKKAVTQMAEVKKRTITEDDWSSIESYISSELGARKNLTFRKDHEAIWTEVDRQVAMKPMKRIVDDKEVADWHSTIELGELSKASEVISADVRRMIFPQARSWFESHSEMDQEQEPMRKEIEGAIRGMMSQQHMDFGFKARFDLSVKEALHHGSFVVEVDMESRLKVSDGYRVENLSAPVWIPHSMWNCYPDSSPSVIGTDMFYAGSMIIVSFIPLHRLKDMARGDGWMNVDKIPEPKKDQDVELVTYYGDLVVPKQDGEIYLPNCKAITANKKIIYYKALEMPYIPIIYSGYERQDVRNPYYTSPIIKLSPMQKLGSVLANKYIEAIALDIEPPIIYDGNDPYFVQHGGPTIAPGAKNPTKGSAEWKTMKVGDPRSAANGLEMAINQIQTGTGVNAIRAGGSAADRQTATEVVKTSQAGEIRVVDFVDKLETQALRPFLYMQHTLNKKHLKGYSFYNPEMDSPDFMRASKKDLPEYIHFEVVGSKGLLGEEQRTQRTSAVTTFASGNPLFAPLLKPAELLKEMYQDAGNKNPERFLNVQQGQDPAVMQIQQQAQEMMQQAQQAIQELQGKIQELESKQQIELAKIQSSEKTEAAKLQLEAQLNQAKLQQEAQIKQAELELKREIADAELSIKNKSAVDEMGSRERIDYAKLGKQIQTDAEGKSGEEAEDMPSALDSVLSTIEEGAKRNADSTIQALHQQAEALMSGLQSIVEQLNRPKRLIRDEAGRPAGVETV